MLISVIIPHLNQEDHLRVGLEALHAQHGITSDVEIIVVDNGSARLPETICSAWPDVQLVSESIPWPWTGAQPWNPRGPRRDTGIY